MSTRDRRLDRAIAHGRAVSELGRREITAARRALGLSRRELGAAVGVSTGQIARFERGEDDDLGLGRLTRLAAGVGLEVSLRLYPDGDAVRDAGHLRLESRTRARVASTIRWRTEVPVRGSTDLRAWDAVVDGTGCVDAFEFETRVGDVQALERRLHRKLRDDASIRHLFLVLADTRHGRAMLSQYRERLRDTFPLDTRETLAAFAAGRCPGANGLIVI